MKNGRGNMVRRHLLLLSLSLVLACRIPARAEGGDADTLRLYQEYQERFASVEHVWELDACGYEVLEEQIFPVALESFGEEELTLIPAMERRFHRLAVFFADRRGNILYRYNQLETNNCIPGQMEQPVENLLSVAFADVNHDQKTDMILITGCVNEAGEFLSGLEDLGQDQPFQYE